MVGKKEDSHYSRCGRTDKGVSSSGQVWRIYAFFVFYVHSVVIIFVVVDAEQLVQVISLYLRSNLKGIGANRKSEESMSEENCGM